MDDYRLQAPNSGVFTGSRLPIPAFGERLARGSSGKLRWEVALCGKHVAAACERLP